MLRSILHAVTGRFERRYDYDASYMRELIDIDPAAFFAFSKVQGLSSYRRAPPEALVAAGLVGTLAEDCGPCTQVGVDIATANGRKVCSTFTVPACAAMTSGRRR